MYVKGTIKRLNKRIWGLENKVFHKEGDKEIADQRMIDTLLRVQKSKMDGTFDTKEEEEFRRKNRTRLTNYYRYGKRGLSRTDIIISQLKYVRDVLVATGKLECEHCGCDCTIGKPTESNNVTVDHIKPLREGGRSLQDNLRLLCSLCHGKLNRKEALENK